MEDTAATMLSVKQQADEAVQRKDWESAHDLYLSALEQEKTESSSANEDEEEKAVRSKIRANLSLCSLKLVRFEKAIEHANESVYLLPGWGKAYARLGSALQAAGALLEANEAFEKAMSPDRPDPFTGCQRELENLKASKRYMKLLLIQQAFREEKLPLEVYSGPGRLLQATNEEEDNYGGVSCMNHRQRQVLDMIRAGRVLPESTTPENELKEQDLILYLQAIDASIALLDTPSFKRNLFVCPGSRAWMVENGRQQLEQVIGDEHIDIYKVLFQDDWNKEDNGTMEKGWARPGCAVGSPDGHSMYTLLFAPNKRCDEYNEELQHRFWGPTVSIELRSFRGVTDGGGNQVLVNGVFLVGLNHWLCVRAGTDVFPNVGTGIKPNGESHGGAFEWDFETQRLVDRNKDEWSSNQFYNVAKMVMGHLWFFRPDEIPSDSFYCKED